MLSRRLAARTGLLQPSAYPSLLFLAPRLLRESSTAAGSLVPQDDGPSALSTARVRRKVRSLDDGIVPPKTRGPPAIEDTWTMRIGDSTWYIILGLMAGCTLWVLYEAQAGLRYRRQIGKTFFDQFKPEERAAQFNNPQAPFSEASLGTPNERFPFIIEEKPREPGEMPRTPSLLERIFAADSVDGRKKLAAKREKLAKEAQAKLEAARAREAQEEDA